MNYHSESNIQPNFEPESRKSGIKRGWGFIEKRPIFSTVVIAILVIIGVWGFMSIKSNKTTRQLETTIVHQRDSLNSYHLMNNVRIFTWAIRSELTRGNREQVEQFFVNYLETGRVIRVMLVDPETGTVIISTNKKDIDTSINSSEILNASSIIRIDSGETYKFANPVMGLDKKIGIVVVEIEK